jgi:antagonist of KipI
MLTTVQDLGREGFGAMGVSASGAADAVALRVGNRLVGNAVNAAALEMTLLGGTFTFPEGATIAFTGSDFGATVDDLPVAPWMSVEVRPEQILRLGGTKSGARCYLCVQGGIAVKEFLGSASTHLLSGLGGLEGRALRKGDVLKIGDASAQGKPGTGKIAYSTKSAHGVTGGRRVAEQALARLAARKVLRVTPGPQSDRFSEEAQKMFYGSTYRVAEESNRMGLRLEGAALPVDFVGEMISEGVSLGAIQITAAGFPIILFVEQQTTGGYPKIANVISADMHSVGQLRPRDEIRFERVEWETARALLREQEELLASKELILEG